MDIAYPKRSSFLEMFEAEVEERQAELQSGRSLEIQLNGGGYDGSVIALIDPSNREHFCSDWEGADPTRFPARIKAAAAALLNCGCRGKFEISHSSGSLRIRAVQSR
jgi:hypothetical protein